uniref:Uncharacterized protein n=1 Tax=Magallana gigas TaxID=29159 RepID=A0A8W8NSA9_MAGGI
MLRAKRKSTSPYVRPSRVRGTRPTSSNATVTMPSVPAASSVSATQTGPTSVASGSRHAVALGSAPSFDPAANVVPMLQSLPSSVASGSAHVPASGIPSSSASRSSISNPPGNASPSTSGMLTLANSFPNYFHAAYLHLASGIPTSIPAVPLGFNTSNSTPLGYADPILYAAWAEVGLFPASDLLKLSKIDSDLEGHPTPRLNFVDVATGSLMGLQGLSCAAGMAYTGKLLDKAA